MLHCSGHQLQSIYIIDVLLIIAFICPHCETPGGKTPWETQAQSLDSLKVPILSITHLAGFYPIIDLQEVMLSMYRSQIWGAWFWVEINMAFLFQQVKLKSDFNTDYK